MKGSKYDFWYELFGGIEFKSLGNKKLSCEVNFDYGS